MASDGPGVTAAYDYELPEHLIASRPADRRDASRLLVLDRETGAISDRRFVDLPSLIRPGDALVVNDSRVFPARLLGLKPTGANAEVLLVRPVEGFDAADVELWEAIVRPGGKLKPGRRVEISDDFSVEIVDSTDDGGRIVRLVGDEPAWTLIERYGHMPLPPYIDRPDDATDRERYQTVYAHGRGSIAAPTAGLHFTDAMLAGLRERGVRVLSVTLHVGIGTFRPVTAERVEEHELHSEVYALSDDTAAELNRVRSGGGRIWAVGTTTCRVLETRSDADGLFDAGSGASFHRYTFSGSPYRFRGVDALVTNFHLPRSSLLMLVSAFAGRDRVLAAYRHAVREAYRFYSYGDSMAIA